MTHASSHNCRLLCPFPADLNHSSPFPSFSSDAPGPAPAARLSQSPLIALWSTFQTPPGGAWTLCPDPEAWAWARGWGCIGFGANVGAVGRRLAFTFGLGGASVDKSA
jgi:hypothetical protein